MNFAIGDRVVVTNRHGGLEQTGTLVERPGWATRAGMFWFLPDGGPTRSPWIVQPDQLRPADEA